MNFLCQNSLKIKEDKFHHLSKRYGITFEILFYRSIEVVVSLRKIVHNGQKYGKKFQSRKSGHYGVS